MKIGICGICGRMGMAILKILLEREHQLGAAFDNDSSVFYGKDAGLLIGRMDVGVKITSLNENIGDVDVLVDFSSPAATLKLLDLAVAEKKPIVIGTTGFSDEEKEVIKDASSKIPVLLSPNMSIGVNILFKLTEIAAKALENKFDVEVFEAHHRLKKDAPSGTAKALVDIVKESVPVLNNAAEISGREGMVGERTGNEIGVMAMRGGDIIGEHTVFFVGNGERIELTHRAIDRDVLARGAVLAVEYLNGKDSGLYSMFDVLGLK
ncbi:4-hydroxy-tetrahydrodipicolinate reductase [Spirochaetota bacterium]